MRTFSSAHVHTAFCDGKNTPDQIAEAARKKGFISLGFSGHAPQDFDLPCCMSMENAAAYQAQVRALKERYAGQMAVYLGLERDAYACVSPDAYDYFIASVHYIKSEDEYGVVDGNPHGLLDYVNRFCGGSGLEMARRYYELLRDYVLASKPDVIGHFDLPRKNNARLHLYSEESPEYRRLALDSLRPLAETGALLEVNTGAIARGYLKTPYPASFLLEAWRGWGGEVIVTSDCHDVRFLDYYFDEAEALLVSLGYRHAVRLGQKETWERYSLV